MNSRADRIERHFATCSAVVAAIGFIQDHSEAAIVYSGVVNITIPGNFAGVYLNMVTGQTGSSAGAVPGHDINPYYGGRRLFMNNSLGNGVVGVGSEATPIIVTFGLRDAYIGPGANFISGFPIFTNNFTPGIPRAVGVQFRRESDSMTLYGWVRINKSASNNMPGTLIDYAYKDDGSAWAACAGNAGGSRLGSNCVARTQAMRKTQVALKSMLERIESHFATCSAVVAAIGVIQDHSEAAIVYSGVVNITIPGNFAGVYLNMVTGQTGTSAASVPGCDLNPYYGGNRFFSPPTFAGIVGTGNQASNVFSMTVGPTDNFITGFPILTNAFIANQGGIVGLRFLRESDSLTLYGWARISKSASNSQPGVIIDYAYQDNGMAIGPWPAPGTLALLALGRVGEARTTAKRWAHWH